MTTTWFAFYHVYIFNCDISAFLPGISDFQTFIFETRVAIPLRSILTCSDLRPFPGWLHGSANRVLIVIKHCSDISYHHEVPSPHRRLAIMERHFTLSLILLVHSEIDFPVHLLILSAQVSLYLSLILLPCTFSSKMVFIMLLCFFMCPKYLNCLA
jgi:hypothetical protein